MGKMVEDPDLAVVATDLCKEVIKASGDIGTMHVDETAETSYTDGLRGREVIVSVGEPWDFVSETGDNLLHGRISAVSEPDVGRGDQRVEIRFNPFIAKDRMVSRLVAHRRYEDTTGIVEQLAAGVWVEINLDYPDKESEEVGDQGISAFLVGGVHLVTGPLPKERTICAPGTLLELETAVLTKALPGKGLVAGDIGTVVRIEENEGDGSLSAYVVAFSLFDGTSVMARLLPGDVLPFGLE